MDLGPWKIYVAAVGVIYGKTIWKVEIKPCYQKHSPIVDKFNEFYQRYLDPGHIWNLDLYYENSNGHFVSQVTEIVEGNFFALITRTSIL